MPGYNIDGKKVIISDDKYRDKYWPELSKIIKDKYFKDEVEIKYPDIVQNILKDCFSFFCNKLELMIQNEKRFSFYLFCHNLHENSIDIHLKLIEGFKLSFSEEKFAGSRRVLKIILEQSVKYDLKGTPNFFYEIKENFQEYCELLEEMLYLGEWALISSEYLARCQLFPKAIGIGFDFDKEEILYLTYQPYPLFFSYIFNDLPKHNSQVALTDCIEEFKTLINDKYSISYDNLCYFVTEILNNPSHRLGVTDFSQIVNNMKENTSGKKEFIDTFFDGLMISKRNALQIEQCYYANQDKNRYMFRPILEYNIEGKIYHIIGAKKWMESLSQLATNCFPFGIFPDEWIVNIDLKRFIEQVESTHDKVLQNQIIKKLELKEFPYEIDIKRFQAPKNQFINIDNTVGDIDILFIDLNNKKIYVCECKHNRARFDYNNWRRDYKNFKDKYEKQLKRKFDWVIANKKTIENHFKMRANEPVDLDLSEYKTESIFIINAPTIYMYNSPYKCYTINDFELLIDSKVVYNDFSIYNEDKKITHLIKHPYFNNIERQL